jgi:hypothetical protein
MAFGHQSVLGQIDLLAPAAAGEIKKAKLTPKAFGARDLSIALEHTRRARNSARGKIAGRSVPGATEKSCGLLKAACRERILFALTRRKNCCLCACGQKRQRVDKLISMMLAT